MTDRTTSDIYLTREINLVHLPQRAESGPALPIEKAKTVSENARTPDAFVELRRQ